MITTKLAQFLPQHDSWSRILQLIWIVFFIAYMLYGQHIQAWNMLFEIKHSVKEFESLRSSFFEKGVSSMLSAYSKVFKTAEIDSTFHACPSKGTVTGWLKHTLKTSSFAPNYRK